METLVSVKAAEQVAKEALDEISIQAEPPVKMSVLEKYLAARGLTVSDKSKRRVVKKTRLTAEVLSKTYTKRKYGEKIEAQREALREAPDIFGDSVDAYVPRKRKQELMNLHKDEHEVEEAFLTETRALSFEREVLDKVVCEREENRYEYEKKLWQLMVKERGLQEVADDGDNETNADYILEQQQVENEAVDPPLDLVPDL